MELSVGLFAQLLVNTLQIGAVYVLFSLGLTLVFGVMKVINFANGLYLVYDLTGNVSGVCPECGAACEAVGESPRSAAGNHEEREGHDGGFGI